MSGQQGVGAANAYQQVAMSGTPQGGGFAGMSQFPSYTPPAPGVGAQQGMDLKSPLAQFALNMAMQQMAPKPGLSMQAPQHLMGLQPLQMGVRNPYGRRNA